MANQGVRLRDKADLTPTGVEFLFTDSAGGVKRLSIDDLKAFLKTYFDTLYAEIGTPNLTTAYFGDSATNGTWRITKDVDDLVIERRESGSWIEKSRVTA